jgi:hypothetical protein
MAKKQTMNEVALRYGLTGGALGLYFGLFFRPVREPSLWLVVVLAALVALVMLLIRAVRERPSFVALLKGAGANFPENGRFPHLPRTAPSVVCHGGKNGRCRRSHPGRSRRRSLVCLRADEKIECRV